MISDRGLRNWTKLFLLLFFFCVCVYECVSVFDWMQRWEYQVWKITIFISLLLLSFPHLKGTASRIMTALFFLMQIRPISVVFTLYLANT